MNLTRTASGAECMRKWQEHDFQTECFRWKWYRHVLSLGCLTMPWDTNVLEKEFKIVIQSGRCNKILSHTSIEIFVHISRQISKPFHPVFKSDAKITQPNLWRTLVKRMTHLSRLDKIWYKNLMFNIVKLKPIKGNRCSDF